MNKAFPQVQVDDKIMRITFSWPHDERASNNKSDKDHRFSVIRGIVVDKAGEKTFTLDGRRLKQAELGKIVESISVVHRSVYLPDNEEIEPWLDFIKDKVAERANQVIEKIQERIRNELQPLVDRQYGESRVRDWT